jgi:PAS domain S-box-containing protein
MVTIPPLSKSPVRSWVPYLVLCGGVLLTLLLARGVVLYRQAAERTAFDTAVDRTRESLQRHINRDLVLLDGLRGLAHARVSLNREQFQTYVSALQLRARYPGVQGLGFASLVFRDKKAEALENLRKNTDPSFSIWPESDREHQSPITYFEPADELNTAAIGYDLFVDPNLRLTLEHAVYTAQPAALSGFGTPASADASSRGRVLVASPVYSKGMTVPSTREDRAARVFGFVFCVFHMDELLGSVADLGFEPRLDSSPGGEEQVHLRQSSAFEADSTAASPPFKATSLLTIANRSWKLVFTGGSTPVGIGSYGIHPWWTAAGLGLTAVLFFLVSAQTKAKQIALLHAEAQRSAEARFQRLVEQSIVGIYVIQNDRFVYVNPRMTGIFGYTAEELTGRPLLTLVAEESRSLTGGNIERRIKGEVDSVHYELRAVRKDGQIIDLEAHGGRTEYNGHPAILGSLIDITERRTAEKKLHAQLARLDLLSRTTRAIGERQDLRSIFQVVIRSLEDHHPIDFGCVCLRDAGAETLTITAIGIKSARLVDELTGGHPVSIDVEENGLGTCVGGDLVYEPNLSESRFPFLQQLARAGMQSVVLSPIVVERTTFGVLITARREIRGFTSPDCEFLRQLSEHIGLATHQAQIYGALHDAYNDLRDTKEAAMQQERLRTIGQMASGIAHDINNAITPVSVYADLLLMDEPNLSPRTREYLEIMLQSVGDVAATIGRLREVYHPRKAAPTLTPVDLNRQIQQVVNLTKARWHDLAQERGVLIKVVTTLAPDLPLILGIENEIREALTNLVFNALDAMSDGGELTLKSYVSAATDESVPSVHVEVTDTGSGMDEETKSRCLEAFFTTKGDQGTGLGLAMVFGIVERHSAEMEIDSSPGAGTTVRLIFPLPTSLSSSDASQAHAPHAMEKLRILVVDDDPILLKSLQTVLESDGHHVVACQGGKVGIDTFLSALAGKESFSVVITDLGMPQVDGRQVLAAVKNASRSTPVIILSGWGKRLVANGDIPTGASCVLSKPPRLHELREALSAVQGRGMRDRDD